GKISDLFSRNGLLVKFLGEGEINEYVMRVLSMNFHEKNISLNNILAGDQQIELGDVAVRSISLINTDMIDLPQSISTYQERNDKETLKGFPIDNMGFLFSVPNFKTIIYNQVIEVVPQTATQRKL